VKARRPGTSTVKVLISQAEQLEQSKKDGLGRGKGIVQEDEEKSTGR
jgi:hypothetical protein